MSLNVRWSDRVPYAAQVMVMCGEQAWLCEVVDLSEGGCGLFRPLDWELDVADIVQLVFFDLPGPAVVVTARVARVEPGSLGFEYHEPQAVPPARPERVAEASASTESSRDADATA